MESGDKDVVNELLNNEFIQNALEETSAPSTSTAVAAKSNAFPVFGRSKRQSTKSNLKSSKGPSTNTNTAQALNNSLDKPEDSSLGDGVINVGRPSVSGLRSGIWKVMNPIKEGRKRIGGHCFLCGSNVAAKSCTTNLYAHMFTRHRLAKELIDSQDYVPPPPPPKVTTLTLDKAESGETTPKVLT